MIDTFVQFCNDYECIFSVVSSISTALAVIVAVYTILEVKRQRESTFKPELIIEEKYFTFAHDKNYSFYYHDNPNHRLEDSIFFNFYLCCYNVGFASAKKIECEFSFDFDKYSKEIYKNLKTLNLEHEIIFKKHKNESVSFESKNEKFLSGSFTLVNGFKSYLNFVLPVSINNDNSRIYIPHSILLVNLIHQYYSFESQNKTDENFYFYFKISYYDIGNIKHKKKYKITFMPSIRGNDYFDGLLKVEEIVI